MLVAMPHGIRFQANPRAPGVGVATRRVDRYFELVSTEVDDSLLNVIGLVKSRNDEERRECYEHSLHQREQFFLPSDRVAVEGRRCQRIRRLRVCCGLRRRHQRVPPKDVSDDDSRCRALKRQPKRSEKFFPAPQFKTFTAFFSPQEKSRARSAITVQSI